MNQIKSPFIAGMGSSFILKLELSKSLTRVSAGAQTRGFSVLFVLLLISL